MEEILGSLAQVGRELVEKGLVTAVSGNLSLRVGERIWISTSGSRLDQLGTETLAQLRLEGQVLSVHAGNKPSMEAGMHLAIYQNRPEINAIVHFHPPMATAWACSDLPLDPVTFEGGYYLGQIQRIPPELPGSSALAQACAQAVIHSDALLLAHHGALTLGKTLQEATQRALILEEQAKITLALAAVGCWRPLPAQALEALKNL